MNSNNATPAMTATKGNNIECKCNKLRVFFMQISMENSILCSNELSLNSWSLRQERNQRCLAFMVHLSGENSWKKFFINISRLAAKWKICFRLLHFAFEFFIHGFNFIFCRLRNCLVYQKRKAYSVGGWAPHQKGKTAWRAKNLEQFILPLEIVNASRIKQGKKKARKMTEKN